MEWVETTGKTVEEAIGLALDQLGVDESDAQVDVVNEQKIGLFGRLKTEARVRARVRPALPRSKDGSGRRQRRPARDRTNVSPESGKERTGQPPRRENQKRAAGGKSARADKENQAAGSRADRPPRQKRAKADENNGGASVMENEVALGVQGDVAKEFLSGLFECLEEPADLTVTVDESEEVILIAIDGTGLGHLIGPRGATLNALQELTRTVVQRKTGARNGRIIVDIAEYRQKRREALAKFTLQVTEEVLQSGTQRVLESMNPADRKVVHDTVNGMSGVETTSEGEEPRRRVVIRPSTGA